MNQGKKTQIPKSWVEVTLGDVTVYDRIQTVSSDEIPGDAWVLELEDIERDTSKLLGRITYAERPSKSNKNIFLKGDVLYGKLRPYLNKVLIADMDGYCSTEIIPLRPSKALNSKFLFYWLKNPVFLRYVDSVTHGLNMPRLGTQHRNRAPIFIAPIEEQERISDKLDKLFARLDICQDKLSSLPSEIFRFEQSVLDEATTGRITTIWRTKNAIANGWPIRKIEDIASKVGSGSTPKGGESVYAERGIPLIRSTNVINGSIKRDDLVYINDVQADDMTSAEAKSGDVLLNITGASIGRVAVLPVDLDGARVNQHVCIIRPSKDVLPEFLCLSLLSSRVQESILQENYGATRQALTKNQVLNLSIYLPSLAEQGEVIRRVVSIGKYVNTVEDEYTHINSRVRQLPNALLSRAFSGNLVPQYSNSESVAKIIESGKEEKSNVVDVRNPKLRLKTRSMADSIESVLSKANDWVRADEAFKLCGAGDGADGERIEGLYAELRLLDKIGRLDTMSVKDEQGRKQYDLIRLSAK